MRTPTTRVVPTSDEASDVTPTDAILHPEPARRGSTSGPRARLPVTRVRNTVRRYGLLPFSDPSVPSLVSLVAGMAVAGSWWGHPAGHQIYAVGEALENDRDIRSVKLWRGKVTLVHRRLWPALVRIGEARAPWQLDGIGPAGLRLLAQVERDGTVRSDQEPVRFPDGSRGVRAALHDLDRRLLILGSSVHTITGTHALEAQSWVFWKAATGIDRFSGTVEAAERVIEAAAAPLTPGIEVRALFPWGRPLVRASPDKRNSLDGTRPGRPSASVTSNGRPTEGPPVRT